MDLTRVDAVLWSFSTAGQIWLFMALIYRRLYREFRVLTAYLLYSSVLDILFFTIFRHWPAHRYYSVFFASMVTELLFQIGILLEVGYNVVAPVRRSLPKPALLILAGMLFSGVALVLVLSQHTSQEKFSRLGQLFIQLNFGVAILRLVIFSAIGLFSQMLGIGWKNHVVQIATGFAGYSMVVLIVELLHRLAGGYDAHFRIYDEIRVIGWCMALGYWSYVLAKKDAPRKEFDPKMMGFLVFLAEAARNNRATAARWYRK